MRARSVLVPLLCLVACGRGGLPAPPTLFPVERSWVTPLPRLDPEVEERVVGPLASDGLRIFAVTANGFVHALDRNSGEILWRVGERPGVLSAGANRLIVRQADGVVWDLDPADGSVRWKASTTVTGELPAVLHGNLVLVAGRGLAALDAASGRALWGASGDEKNPTTAAPLVVGPSVLVGEADGTLRCRDSATGASLWTYRTQGPIRAAPWVDERQRLFLGTTDGRILALRFGQRGRPIWRWRIGADVRTPPVGLHDAVLVATFEDVLYALRRRNGHLWWRAPLPSRPISGPLVMGTAVLVACHEDEIVAFDGRSGKKLGGLKTPAEMATPPLLLAGRIHVGLRDGSVVAMELGVAPPPPPPSPSPSPSGSPTPP